MQTLQKFVPPRQALRVLSDDDRYKNRFEVAGSTGRVYRISYDNASGAGYWVCSCPGNISHGDCKHLQACGLIGRKRAKIMGLRAPMYPSRLGS